MVLDEPTASLDALGAEIYENLNELVKNKTSILYRTGLLTKSCDKIVLLDNDGTVRKP